MPQYTEKQLRTTKLDKGEIYLTVTAKHATIADMQRTKFNSRFEKSLRRKSFLSKPFNENFIQIEAAAASLSGNLLLNCSKPGLKEGSRHPEAALFIGGWSCLVGPSHIPQPPYLC